MIASKSPAAGCAGWTSVVAARIGEAESATRLFAAAAAICDEVGQVVRLIVHAIYTPFIERARALLDPNAFDRQWAAGLALALTEAVEAAAVRLAINGTEVWFDIDGPGLVRDGDRMRERRVILVLTPEAGHLP